jgi:hypothetical protein
MIGVNSFYDTVVEHMLNSLAATDPHGRTQALRLVENVPRSSLRASEQLPPNFDQRLTSAPMEKLLDIISVTIRRLHLSPGGQDMASRFGDVIRALFFFCSKIQASSNLGRLWLQGVLDNETNSVHKLGFSGRRLSPVIVIQGLTWLMSLNGSFSVLALDQLDTIIKSRATVLGAPQATTNENIFAASRIINEVSAGLGTLINLTYKSTTVLSLLPETWESLVKFGLTPATRRYMAPWLLSPIERAEDMAALVAKRLAPGFKAHNFVPPYPSWPFPINLFNKLVGRLSPRQVLIRREKYLDKCLDHNQALECQAFPTIYQPHRAPGPPISGSNIKEAAGIFENNRQSSDPSSYKTQLAEDSLWPTAMDILAQCVCLEERLDENDDAEELVVAPNYSTKNFPLLHATLQRSGLDGQGRPLDRYLSL